VKLNRSVLTLHAGRVDMAVKSHAAA
jgi:hypothetical protein